MLSFVKRDSSRRKENKNSQSSYQIDHSGWNVCSNSRPWGRRRRQTQKWLQPFFYKNTSSFRPTEARWCRIFAGLGNRRDERRRGRPQTLSDEWLQITILTRVLISIYYILCTYTYQNEAVGQMCVSFIHHRHGFCPPLGAQQMSPDVTDILRRSRRVFFYLEGKGHLALWKLSFIR